MNRLSAIAVAALLALPLGSAAYGQKPARPQPGAEAGRPGAMPGSMVQHLIAIRSELQLTDAQVTRLNAIQQKYQDQNRPVLDRMRAARPDSAMRHGLTRDSVQKLTPEQRTEMRRKMQDDRQAYVKAHPEVTEARKQLRDNMQAERKEVNDVLTADQRTLLRQHMAAGRRMGAGNRMGAGGRMRARASRQP
ncbi:MAG: Spy/CpxP family protein refolding chaperone [Gemmatimonadota bacterium]